MNLLKRLFGTQKPAFCKDDVSGQVLKPKREQILDELHHVGRPTPQNLIAFINEQYPQYKGMCIYDAENKCLNTKEPETVDFYFDAFHGVVHIRGFKTCH